MVALLAFDRIPDGLLGSLFDHEPVPFGIVDSSETTVLYANPAFDELAGQPVLGRALGKVLPAIDGVASMMASGALDSEACTAASLEGTWTLPSSEGSVVRLKVATVTAGICAIALLDGGKGSAEIDSALRRFSVSLGLLRRLTADCSVMCDSRFCALALESVPDAVVAVDPDERVVLWSPSAEDLYGRTVADMLGKPLSDAFTCHWASGESQREANRELKEHGRWRGENVHETWDGRLIAVESTVALVEGGAGHGSTSVSVIRDVSERRHHDERRSQELSELKAEWRRLRTIMDNLPVAMVMTDADGRFVESNEGLKRLWHGEPVAGVGDSSGYQAWWSETGEPVKPHQWTWSRALATGEPVHGDVLDILRFDGTRGTVVSSAVPILDGAGAVQGTVVVTEDITEQRARMRYSETLNRVNILLHSSLSTDEALPDVLEEACNALGAEAALIALRDDGSWLIEHGHQLLDGMQGASYRGADLPLAEEALRTGDLAIGETPVLSSPPTARMMPSPAVIETLALAAPLVMRGDAFGVIQLSAWNEGLFGAREREFVRQLAASVSFAIANARLFDEQVETATLRALLTDIDAEIGSLLDMGHIFERIMPRSASAMRADVVVAVLRDERGWRVAHVTPPDAREPGDALSEGLAHLVRLAIESRRPAIVHDTRQAVSDAGETLPRPDACSVAAVPLLHGDEVFGVIVFERRHRPQPWTTGQVDFANRLGAHLSLAVENAALFAKEQERARTSEALAKVDRIIHSTLEPAQILQRALTEGAEALDAEAGSIAVRSDSYWVTRYVYGPNSDPIGYRYVDDTLPYLAEMRETRGPVLVDVATRPDVKATLLESQGDVAYILTIPLFVRDEHVGLLFFNRTGVGRFSSDHVEFGRQLGMSLSVALENARLYQGERHIAETLQETLLVLPGHVPGIDFARLYRSATESTRVGGDFIDVFPLSDGRVVFALGDVSGKGLEAAAITAMVRNTLRVYFTEGLPPDEVAKRTNSVIHTFTEPDTFVTAAFGILDPSNGRIAYTSAGHPPVMIVSPTGEVSELDVLSPVLGALSEMEFVCAEYVLEPGHCLLAYSDGVIEARGTSGLFGEERLLKLVATLGGRRPQAVVSGVFARIEEYSHRELRDDIAILALCREDDDAPSR